MSRWNWITRLTVGAMLCLLGGAIALGAMYWRSESGDAAADRAATATPAGMATVASAETITRGEYLTRAGNCMACHTAKDGAPWAGGRGIETPFGIVYASNLTPHADGLGGWSANDFWRALHHGRSKDGRMLYPAFPYTHFTRVTRADADAMHAYLGTLPAVAQANRPHALRWPVNTQLALGVWRALYFRPGVQQDDPQRDASWNRGAYLVQGLGHCAACHSARNALGGSEVLDLSGGMIPMQAWYAPSLADTREAGVADWPRDEIVQLLATGSSPRASTLGPMAEVVLHSTQHLTRSDLEAMAVFLQSVPPAPGSPPANAGVNRQATAAPTSPTAPPAEAARLPAAAGTVAERGARLYGEHCASCHGERGEGVPGAYPRLAGNRAVTLPVTANLVQVVIHGGFPPSTAGQPRPFGMPPFALELSDAEVAAVLTYLRSAWGNQAGLVSELDVAQQRSLAR